MTATYTELNSCYKLQCQTVLVT